jgi:hypothetical protein
MVSFRSFRFFSFHFRGWGKLIAPSSSHGGYFTGRVALHGVARWTGGSLLALAFYFERTGRNGGFCQDITYLRYNQAPGWRCILLLCSEGRFVSNPTWTVDGQLAQWQNGVLGSDEVGGRDEVDKYASLFFFFMLLSMECVHRDEAYYSHDNITSVARLSLEFNKVKRGYLFEVHWVLRS